MQSLFNFIIKPKQERYDNKKYIDDNKEVLENMKKEAKSEMYE